MRKELEKHGRSKMLKAFAVFFLISISACQHSPPKGSDFDSEWEFSSQADGPPKACLSLDDAIRLKKTLNACEKILGPGH